ncbi:MAG: substrate-binding domain-containing protein [Desulfurococcales archaeon]|nr:substrate-binding domain-containing protein [Desulfurococcales archaeon]
MGITGRKAILFVIVSLIVVAVILSIVYTQLYGSSATRLRAATTTSLYATGLLDYLSHHYEASHPNVVIDYIAVGSGEALERAARGDACIVLVHAPSLEKRYLEEGYISNHVIFAYNYFVILGPKDDPAGVRDASNAVEAFRKIYIAGEEGRALFVSRGDRSGTNVRELMIWNMTGLDPHGKDWYLETGQGMGETLVIADEKGAYTLSDIGTYLKYELEGRLHTLTVLYTNSTELINIYSAYTSTRCSSEEMGDGLQFIEWLAGSEAQSLIAEYGRGEYPHPLFYPAAGKIEYLQEAWRILANG